jgi:hypothetical protein
LGAMSKELVGIKGEATRQLSFAQTVFTPLPPPCSKPDACTGEYASIARSTGAGTAALLSTPDESNFCELNA